jgi:hypothetical protein
MAVLSRGVVEWSALLLDWVHDQQGQSIKVWHHPLPSSPGFLRLRTHSRQHKPVIVSAFRFRLTDTLCLAIPASRFDQYPLEILSLAIVALFAKTQPAATMSDSLNNDMQLAPFEENVDSIDWATLQEEVMQEPWFQFDDYDWTGCGMTDQGAEALPGDR